MADRVVAMSEDATHSHYLWDVGVLVSFNKQTKTWSKQRIAHPNDETFAAPVLADAPRHTADVEDENEYGSEFHGDN